MNKLTIFSRVILAIAIMLCVALPTLAHDFEVDGIYYNYLDETAKTVEVTFRGSYVDSYSNEYTGSVTIPSSVLYNGTTYSVSSIGEYAFYKCTGLTSVTIPNSVSSIGSSAFEFCSDLISITIPNSVSSIGSSAFYGCTGLTSVTIGNSVTEIGYYVFAGCSGLTSVTIPNSVTSIGSEAFYGCTGLTSVTIPNSVTSIGSNAFSYCSGLTSATIGNSVTSIGSEAFYGCTGLTSVTISNSVTSIGKYAFFGTAWYNNLADGVIYINNVLYMYKGSMPNGTSISVKDGTVSISPSAFSYCRGLTSVSIGNSVTSIGQEAFLGCSGLTSITIPNSVTSIGESAFRYCRGLTELNYNAENCTSMGSVGYPVFGSCSNLKIINIGSSVKSIPSYAFSGCDGLKYIISLNTLPPVCASSSSFYENNYEGATLYVPKDSYGKYFIDDVWGQFTNIKKIEILVSSITLNNSSIELDKYSTATITATIAPSNATIKNIVWTSSNPQIATVDQSGKVTAFTHGTATITAKSIDGSNVSASCKVTVNGPTITLSQIEATLPVNEIMTLSYSITNSATKIATWSTSNEYVAYVKTNSDGSATIVGMADGVATITATMVDNGQEYSASCVVTVGVGGVEGVEMDNNAVEVSRYDIHGRLLSEPTKGINIVKMSNGTTRKEIVKN